MKIIHEDLFWFDRKNQHAYIFQFATSRLANIENTITDADIETAVREGERLVDWYYNNRVGPQGTMKHHLR